MNNAIHQARLGASYDSRGPSLVVHDLSVSHPAVCAEATRWSTGQRGPAIGTDDLTDVDLSAFVTQALTVGAQAIATAGGVQDTYNLEQLVTDVGTRTAESSTKAAEATSAMVKSAGEMARKASVDAEGVIVKAGDMVRKSVGDTVESAKKDLRAEVTRLFGGDHPEFVTRLSPLLESFGRDMNDRVATQTGELLDKAAKQFDPDDPTSPMAKHTRELQKQQAALTATVAQNHKDVAGQIEAVSTALKVAAAAADVKATITKVTPIKGAVYAAQVHAVMQEVAAGLGDEYTDTSGFAGTISRCMKGDGVLAINGGESNVVLEMADTGRAGWNDYLDEAERNRRAAGSLGMVRDLAQNAGQTIRVLSPRRIVMVFDPARDDASLLRTVVQLLRVGVITASARQDLAGIATAQERINAAVKVISEVDVIRTTAGLIRKHAAKIDTQGEAMQTSLSSLLTQALTALSGAAPATPGVESGEPTPSAVDAA